MTPTILCSNADAHRQCLGKWSARLTAILRLSKNQLDLCCVVWGAVLGEQPAAANKIHAMIDIDMMDLAVSGLCMLQVSAPTSLNEYNVAHPAACSSARPSAARYAASVCRRLENTREACGHARRDSSTC